MKIELSQDRRTFRRDGRPFFYLADTVWSAFTNATIEEWREYLDIRKTQGFNVLQINILRQWDASGSEPRLEPFALNEDGTYDYAKRNEAYFDRADEMLRMAVERGFVPALVLLWCNYVPDTWASVFQSGNKMPLEAVEDYVEYAVGRFAKYDPIFFVSGDTNFPTEQANAYYRKALETAKRIAPDCLATLHIQGRLRDLPELFENHADLDFYMYQSGHNSEFQRTSHEIAEHFYRRPITRPVINGEPCYEQMSYSRNVYGRYTAYDVRRSAWQSLLAGGGAGVTYGAHGIWSWHRKGAAFGIVEGEGFDNPYAWRDAVKFEGAWDYSFARHLFEQYKLIGSRPATDLVLNRTPEIRAARTEGTIAIYVPVNTEIRLAEGLDVEAYAWTTIDLERRRFAVTDISQRNGLNVLPMHDFESDVAIIGTLKN